MKTKPLMKILTPAVLALMLSACKDASQPPATNSVGAKDQAPPAAGQSAVQDKDSKPDVVRIAAASADHTTLVKAIQVAEYADVLSNAGPFTVFAPTNAAFDKLPPGTLETLTKPENKDKLRDILEYHVAVATYRPDMLRDGLGIGMANSGNIKISNKDGKIMVNDSATIVGTVPASNGIIHVIDAVLLPPSK
jgi:uncharacterized surface protein with fasciclin (FAS1) repeats